MGIYIVIVACVISFALPVHAENVWKKHLEGKAEVPNAIRKKEEPPGDLTDLVVEHHKLVKTIKKMRVSGAPKEKIREKEKKAKEIKDKYFKHKQRMRVSSKQQRAIGMNQRFQFGTRKSSPQRRAIK